MTASGEAEGELVITSLEGRTYRVLHNDGPTILTHSSSEYLALGAYQIDVVYITHFNVLY